MPSGAPRFSQVEPPGPVARLIGRWCFGTSGAAALAAALLFSVLPPAAAGGPRAALVGGCVLYAAWCAYALRGSTRPGLQFDMALLVTALGALVLVGCAGLAVHVGLRNPGLGLAVLLLCQLCATTRWRFGLSFGAACAALLVLLAVAEARGALGLAATPWPAVLRVALVHALVLACAAAGGVLISRVLDHYLQSAARREERFRGLLAIAADRYWEMDAQFRYTEFSDSRESPDAPSAARIGHAPWELPAFGLGPEQLDAHRADLEAHRPFRGLVTRGIGPNGRTRFISLSGAPRFGADGGFLGYWGVGRNVTAEVRAQQAVAAGEHRYRELFERSPSPLLLHRKGVIVDANEAAARLFGFPDANALRGTAIAQRFPPGEARARVEQRSAQLENLPAGQSLPIAEWDLQSLDGRALQVQTTAVRVDTGSGPAILTLILDITERRLAEAALRRSEALLSHLFATNPDCMTLTDMATDRYALVNEGFVRVSGHAREDTIGRTSSELGIWEDPEDRRRLGRALRQHGQVLDLPLRFRRRDGSPVAMLVSAARFDFEGRDFVVINARDVSAREQSRLEVEAILNTVSLAIAFVRGGRIVRTNPRHEQMFGWSADELDRESLAALWAEPAEFDAARRSAGAALREGTPFDAECRMRRRDGRLLWCRVQAQAVDPHDPIGGGTIWTAEDITERREFQQTLAAARDAAEAANRAKSAFLANTSHEIRTPLNGLLGLARLALQAELPEARRRQYLHQILDSAEGLTGIISDILDLSRIEAGKLALESTAFGLRELLASVHHAYLALAEAKGLALTLDIGAGVPAHVGGDPLRLRQILSNFLTNAIKFTERGSVRIGAEALAGGRLRFVVADTGPGIDAATQQRLFMPFSQADESTTRRYGGTGLGLSICRELARLMGGEVGLDSAPGDGSRFWAELPLAAAEASAAGAEGEPGDDTRLRGVRVLMAEDNPVNMLIGVAMLEEWGVDVVQAGDGAMAIDAVRLAALHGRPFDLVLMDVHMPVMSGHAAVRRLREQYDAAALPVIALTAAALVSERDEALGAGMNDFLTKPIDPQRLKRALLQHLKS